VRRLAVASGRFLPEMEWDRSSPVTVLGQTTARELFPGRDPVGQVVRIGDWRMRVAGVLASRGQQLGLVMDDVAARTRSSARSPSLSPASPASPWPWPGWGS
jgi:putative ABC transport system permease protein